MKSDLTPKPGSFHTVTFTKQPSVLIVLFVHNRTDTEVYKKKKKVNYVGISVAALAVSNNKTWRRVTVQDCAHGT